MLSEFNMFIRIDFTHTLSVRKKRLVFELEHKLNIIECLKKGDCASILAKEYNVGRSTISNIKGSESKLLNFQQKLDNESKFHSRKCLKTTSDDKLGDVMYKWILQKRSIGIPISVH